jgi:hypothetical protein
MTQPGAVAATLAVAGVVIGLAAVHYGFGRADDGKPGFGAGVLAFGVLSAVAGRSMGERFGVYVLRHGAAMVAPGRHPDRGRAGPGA